MSAILVWLMWSDSRRRAAAGVVLGLSIATSLTVLNATRAYAWPVLFNHTFVRKVLTEEDLAGASHVSLAAYAKALGRGLTGDFVLHMPMLWLFAILSAAAWAGAWRTEAQSASRLKGLLGAVWLAVLVHFLLFPMLADRFFVPHCVVITICVAALLRRGASFRIYKS